ncbi:unnamed protein product [Miscanthus lutarioriparius]|uniref:Protein kinase domain-containing protein n=1 Tax=Miscanthus lutarioriparius TaxID=422564 RepID=A0A811PIL7_9POAL|nr:unnamed protein product [Miscanthus lutarioriparius]
MMNCLISWSPRLRLCYHRDVDPSSPCCSPSSYAAQTQSSVHLRCSGGVAAAGGSVVSGAGTTTTTTRKFTLAQLSAATGGFRDSNLVGEGGFGRVYRGRLDDAAAGGLELEVAVKQLCRGGAQGSREFLVECSMLMMLRHPNLVSLVGYCAEAQERLLVYELLPRGSLDAHLFVSKSLAWDARVKVAVGAARGLRYLHEVVAPPVIYRDLKSSNILLGDDLSPKLSDFGLARLGPEGDDTHVSTRVMGTYGYCAPDYAVTGKLSVKSDVYSFGVLLLELLTGRRAFDAHTNATATRDESEEEDEERQQEQERRLLVWARPHLQQLQGRGRGRCLEALADPAMQGRYPRRGLYQVAVIASLCLHDEPNLRPTMTDVTQALEHVASQPWRVVSCRDRDGDQEEAAGGGSSRWGRGRGRGRGRGGTPRASAATADDSWSSRR